MMDEPTRGIDVGAKYEIYELIINMAKQGRTIIVVSSEMPEILGITNRIGVMSNGYLSGIVNTKETNQEELLRLSADINSSCRFIHHKYLRFSFQPFSKNNFLLVSSGKI